MKRRRQGCELFERGVGALVLIARHDQRRAALLGDLHRGEFAGEEVARVGRLRALLAAPGEQILVGAPDVVLRGHVLAGLGHRVDAVELLQPRVDEAPAHRPDAALRLKALFRLHDERRARHGLHAPASPLPPPRRAPRAAIASASRPEPHTRLTVAPGTDTGRPAKSSAMRATLRLSSPAWLAHPSSTSSMAAGSREGLRLSSAASGTAARSSARTAASAPP
jgi:hypothetical protein